MQRVGVFGASFNPPTLGHQDVVNQALADFDQILLVPSLSHPFGKKLLSIEHRLAMLKLFIEPWQQEYSLKKSVKIFNVEAVIASMHPKAKHIYTYDVLETLEAFYKAYHEPFALRFIVGPDNAAKETWQKFYRYQEIEQKWPLYIVQERVEVRSTYVKEKIAHSQTEASQLKEELLFFVPEKIADYLLEYRLYAKCSDL